MTRVLLVRHAATDWTGVRLCGRTDLTLSRAGRAQAKALAAGLARAGLDARAVRSSPARRARETARPLAEVLGVDTVIDGRLREADFGAAEGRTFDDVRRTWPGIAAALLSGDGAIDWPGGDGAGELARRAGALARELDATSDADALLVTHGGPIRAILTALGVARDAAPDVGPADVLVLERDPRWHIARLDRVA